MRLLIDAPAGIALAALSSEQRSDLDVPRSGALAEVIESGPAATLSTIFAYLTVTLNVIGEVRGKTSEHALDNGRLPGCLSDEEAGALIGADR